MESFKKFVNNVFSTNYVGIFIFVATAVILTLLLSSRYYFHHSVIENGVSKRDLFATRSIRIEDTDKTQKVKNEIAKKVIPIMVPVQDDFIRLNLVKSIDKIKMEREATYSFEQKKDELTNYFNLINRSNSDIAIIDFLLKMPSSRLDKISNVSVNTLHKILKNDITEDDINEKFGIILEDNLSEPVNLIDKRCISFLIGNVITPNVVVDEEATETSKKNAINAVKPVYVTYHSGSKIVSAGQVVSKVQRDALKRCGYNVIQLNISGIVGIFVIVTVFLFCVAYQIRIFEPCFRKRSYYALVSFLMILTAAIAVLLPTNYCWLLLPLPAFTILISIFLNSRVAAISSTALLSILCISLQCELSIMIIFISGIWAIIYVINKIDYTQRLDIFKVGLCASLFYIVTLTGIFFMDYNLKDLNSNNYWNYLIAFAINGILSSGIAFSLLPLLESFFKIPTPYGLLELANNNEILQKLQKDAPGTYHHSKMVSMLAEAAAEAIGANTVLVSIGALYHDIGKIKRPLFFIENQSYYGIDNPHEKYNPKFSKMVITTHPKDGIEEAKKYHLSPAIYPFILEHHGDSIASYFYNQAKKEQGEENVSEDEYRYNAPRPSSKESAIVMLADGVESAVRSLKNPTFEDIENMINKIVNARLLDGQLSDSPLTLNDLKVITATFNRVLRGMQHQRIKYDEDFKNIQNKVSHLEEQNEK